MSGRVPNAGRVNPGPNIPAHSVPRREFLQTVAAGLGVTAIPSIAADFSKAVEAMKPPERPMGIPSLWVGAATDRSAVVKVKLPPQVQARLLVLPPGGTPRAVVSEPLAETGGKVRTFVLHELEAASRYMCTLEVNGGPATFPPAVVRTFPKAGKPASFAFAFGSCARTGSEHEVFITIRGKDPVFFLHLGDMHYSNISRNDPRLFRAAWDTVLSSVAQGAFYRTVPLACIWDDHDFGPNGADARSPSRAAARRVYREYAPHYPLPAGDGDAAIYQAFTCGRARFILTDLRSERSPASMRPGPAKTMMGPAQKEWFKRELLTAAQSHALVFWGSSVPWIGSQEKGDGWQSYAHERGEIAAFIAQNRIKNLVILCGDAHMLAADDGTNSDYSEGGGLRIPVLHGSALDQRGSYKGGPYSQGFHLPERGEGCFGWVKVHDDGQKVKVDFSGRNDRDEEKLSLSFAV
jgi:alkaline phosphatase D